MCQMILSSKPTARGKGWRKYEAPLLLPYFIKCKETDYLQNILQIDSNIVHGSNILIHEIKWNIYLCVNIL
jgi:hypothetical protein